MPNNFVVLQGKVSYFNENRTKTGRNVANFSLGVGNPGQGTGLSFINVTAWEIDRRIAAALAKGWNGTAMVTGRLKQEVWEGKNGKQKEVKVVADEVCLVSPRPRNEQPNPPNRVAPAAAPVSRPVAPPPPPPPAQEPPAPPPQADEAPPFSEPEPPEYEDLPF